MKNWKKFITTYVIGLVVNFIVCGVIQLLDDEGRITAAQSIVDALFFTGLVIVFIGVPEIVIFLVSRLQNWFQNRKSKKEKP